MTVTYSIDENDYLTHQLFIATRSKSIRKKRQRNKYFLPLIYIAFGLFFYSRNMEIPMVIFFAIGILWFFFYPSWERQRYYKSYQKFINENYQDRINQTLTLKINNHQLSTSDGKSEGQIPLSELHDIVEIPTAIFLRLKNGQSLILPLDKISDVSSLKSKLNEIAKTLEVQYINESNWKWK